MPDFHSNRPGSIQPKIATPSPFLAKGEQAYVPSRVELMSDIWYSSRDNINLLLEICHQVCVCGGRRERSGHGMERVRGTSESNAT